MELSEVKTITLLGLPIPTGSCGNERKSIYVPGIGTFKQSEHDYTLFEFEK